ncbi:MULTISPECIES: hypothetical protein [Photobacterium]|uniref:Asparaginyl-tRNA synthetase n=1 Tax=Photobacterium ganghwense TaxID=320778 RepID=A0A0J1HI36_9GAMM|nr:MULTISPECIES: hypothetical protein [Photobacterium]KLV11260.1 hypothetical protein ABT57_03225 [Photobacterium ganghwense]MBV1843421.1 hypothetical protein [Photobacterium ganghwense]PSU05112.1 hypothetical protein C9I92_21945 [Photobacterium ganghwense]QSV13724.1 hypothetical protein FH974_13480 [Photobacterium ganghwense]
MLKTNERSEVKLIAVSLICAALLVIGHLILAKSLADKLWVEYLAAAIPFLLFGIGVFAVKFALANDKCS